MKRREKGSYIDSLKCGSIRGTHVDAWKKKMWVIRCGVARGRKEGEKTGDET